MLWSGGWEGGTVERRGRGEGRVAAEREVVAMDDLNRKFRSIDWKGLTKQARKVQASTASALKDLVMTDVENLARACTADTTWGASGGDLMRLAQSTYSREEYVLVMGIVWQRLGSRRWRCVLKALDVLRTIVLFGSERARDEIRGAVEGIRGLEGFRCIDTRTGRDEGEGVRKRACALVEIVLDDELRLEEKERERGLRDKVRGGGGVGAGGISSDDYRYGGMGGSGPYGHGGAYGHDGAYGGEGQYGGARTTGTGGGLRMGTGDGGGASGGYDDEPAGRFGMVGKQSTAAGTIAAPVGVDDLLGGGDVVTGAENAVEEDENDDSDDEGFNPRGGQSGDILEGLGIGDVATPAPSAPAVPTSLLVQNLAAQAAAKSPYPPAGGALAVVPAIPNVQQEDAVYGGVFSATPSTQHQEPHHAPPLQPLKTLKSPEKDPFSDLLSSAKDAGVL